MSYQDNINLINVDVDLSFYSSVVCDDFIVHLNFGDDKFRPYLKPPIMVCFEKL